MSKVLGNLNLLKTDMEQKGWFIDSFEFKYKSKDYIVLVKLYVENEKRPEFALLKLEFLKQNNFNHSLEVPANANGLMVDPKIFRKYFNIEYSENLGDIFKQFYQYFSDFIPSEMNELKTKKEEIALVNSLNRSDEDHPNKVYCFAVKRNSLKANGDRGRRSPYNDNKARILRKELYNKLYTDDYLSFYFSKNPEDERTDEAIIYNWHKNRSND